MIEWLKRLRAAFGASFLWLVCLIYFTQGFRSFVWTAVSYQLKDTLKLSPSSSQFLFSIAFFPWSIKPLYGILSDCIPIKGRKRVPYLVIATVLSLVPWPILGLNATSRSSMWLLITFLTVQNLGSAMADVVVDAMIAEAVRHERVSFAGDLQSISWLAMAFGGICGSLTGGFALTNFHIHTIFLLFSVLPSIQLLSCGLVEENSVDSKAFPEFSELKSSDAVNGNSSSLDEDSFSEKKSNTSITRRKKSNKGSKKKSVSSKVQVTRKADSLASQWFQSLKAATFSLCRAFKQPIILSVQLLKVLEMRKKMLQKEQGMAFTRAVAVGFDVDHLPPLISFAECFGASCLIDACRRYKELWKRKRETGQWLEIEAAKAMSNRADFSAMNASGIVLLNMTTKPNELAEKNGKATYAGSTRS